MNDAGSRPVPDVALLIDWENLKYSLLNRNRSWQPNISLLRDTAENHGRLVVARAYADWQEHQRDASDLYASGVEPVYVPVRHRLEGKEARIKNSVDVKVAVDCVELCYRFPTIQTYILVSGDQDFIHIINSLRPYGKRTVVIGTSWSTSARLAEQVDAMIYYDRVVDPRETPDLTETLTLPVTAAVPPVVTDKEDAPEEVANEGEAAISRLNEAILDLVREYREQKRPLLLSQAGLELRVRAPRAFNRWGRGRLGGITTALANEGLIQKVDRGLVSWLYLPGEIVPEVVDLDSRTENSLTSRYWKGRELFSELNDSEKQALIQTIANLERDLSFLSFGRIRAEVQDRLANKFHDVDCNQLVADCIEKGILERGQEREWFDPSTGGTGSFSTLHLSSTHSEVAKVLAG